MQKQLKKALQDLQEEKEMNRCLLENQAIWQQKVTGLESQIRDLAQTKDKVPNIYIIFLFFMSSSTFFYSHVGMGLLG